MTAQTTAAWETTGNTISSTHCGRMFLTGALVMVSGLEILAGRDHATDRTRGKSRGKADRFLAEKYVRCHNIRERYCR